MNKQNCTKGPVTTAHQGGYERKRADGSPWRSLLVGTPEGKSIAEVCIQPNGKWDDPEAQANAELIAEAFNTLHQTGYTPAELAEQRSEFLRLLVKFEGRLADENYDEPHYVAFEEIREEARAALSKHQPVTA